MRKGFPVLLFGLSLVFSGCGEDESRPAPKPARDTTSLHIEHEIRGSEDREDLTVTLQFRRGEAGRNIRMPGKGGVTLDGIPLSGDSSALGGVFYEATLPAATAPGRHVITYPDGKGRTLSDSFTFGPFMLLPALPPIRRGADWSIVLSGLADGSPVLVALTDTAFLTNDLVETIRVRNGAILLRGARLARLAPGPLLLQISSVDHRSPGNGAKGQIRVEYGVRQELVLKER
jgi:hypothetical protein